MKVATYEFDDLTEGMSVHYTTQLTKKDIEAFAELSGDISPLHVDEEFGKQSQFGTNIVHGLLLSSHFSTIVGVLLPGKNAVLMGVEVNFVKPVPVNSEVIISGSIIALKKAQRMIVLRLLAFLDQNICAEGIARVKVVSGKGEKK